MIELQNNSLKISFPDVHRDAQGSIDFQRTLRIPDDGREYPLPAGLGSFPLSHIEDFSDRTPKSWNRRGGVMNIGAVKILNGKKRPLVSEGNWSA